jgi:hypothetical protein
VKVGGRARIPSLLYIEWVCGRYKLVLYFLGPFEQFWSSYVAALGKRVHNM